MVATVERLLRAARRPNATADHWFELWEWLSGAARHHIGLPAGPLSDLAAVERLGSTMQEALDAFRASPWGPDFTEASAALVAELAAVRLVAEGLIPMTLGDASHIGGESFHAKLGIPDCADFARPDSATDLPTLTNAMIAHLGPTLNDRTATALQTLAQGHGRHKLFVPFAHGGGSLRGLYLDVRAADGGAHTSRVARQPTRPFTTGVRNGVTLATEWIEQRTDYRVPSLSVGVHVTRLGRDQPLEGGSVALGVALALVGRLIGQDPDVPWAITGSLGQPTAERTVGRVHGAVDKQQAVARSGLRQFLRPNTDEWSHGEPVDTLDEAITYVYGPITGLRGPQGATAHIAETPTPLARWATPLDRDPARHLALALPQGGTTDWCDVLRQAPRALWCEIRGSDAESRLHDALMTAIRQGLHPAPIEHPDPWRTLAEWRRRLDHVAAKHQSGTWPLRGRALRVFVHATDATALRELVSVIHEQRVPDDTKLVLVADSSLWSRVATRHRRPNGMPRVWRLGARVSPALAGAGAVAGLASLALVAFLGSTDISVPQFREDIRNYVERPVPGKAPVHDPRARQYTQEKAEKALQDWWRPNLAARLWLVYAEVAAERDQPSEALRARLRARLLAESRSVKQQAARAIASSLAHTQDWGVLRQYLTEEAVFEESERATLESRAAFGMGDFRVAGELPGVLGEALAPYAKQTKPPYHLWWMRDSDSAGHIVHGEDHQFGWLPGRIGTDVVWGEAVPHPETLAYGIEGIPDIVALNHQITQMGLREATLYRVHPDGSLERISDPFHVGDWYRGMLLPDNRIAVGTGSRRRGIVVFEPRNGRYVEVPSPWPSLEERSDIVGLQAIGPDTLFAARGPWDAYGVAWIGLGDDSVDIVPVHGSHSAIPVAAEPHSAAYAAVQGPVGGCYAPSVVAQGIARIERNGAPLPDGRIAKNDVVVPLPCQNTNRGFATFALGRLFDISTDRHHVLAAGVKVEGQHSHGVLFAVQNEHGRFESAVLWNYELYGASDLDDDGIPDLRVGHLRGMQNFYLGFGETPAAPPVPARQHLDSVLLDAPPNAGLSWQVAQRLARWGLRHEAYDELDRWHDSEGSHVKAANARLA